MESLLAKKLKAFQKEFRTAHGREPRRSDIAKVPEMAAVYDTWTAMSGGAATKSSADKGKSREKSSSSGSSSRPETAARREKANSNSSSSTKQSMGPPPTTPTKPRRSSEQRTAAASSSTSSTLPVLPPHSPPRASSSSASRLPSTPTTSSRTANPFKTPTKPASQAPSTPGSGVKLRTPPAAAGSPSSHSALNNVDSRFHYNLSPVSFRKLVADLSPRKGVSNAVPLRSAHEQVYTPRTKARKRLRGEEVPPTPRGPSSAGVAMSPSKGRSSSQGQEGLLRPGSALGDGRPAKRRASSRSERELGPLWGRSESDSAAQKSSSGTAVSAGNLFSRTASAGSQPLLQRADQSQTDAPSLRLSPPHDDTEVGFAPSPPRQEDHRSAANANALTAGESRKGRKFRSLFDGGEDQNGAYGDDDDAMDLSNGEDVALRAEGDTGNLDVKVAPAAITKNGKGRQASRETKQPPRPAPAAPLLLDSSSEESETEGKGGRKGSAQARKEPSKSHSPSKAVFLRAYQRFGQMSLDRGRSANGDDDDDSDASSADDGPLSFGLLSPRKKRPTAITSVRSGPPPASQLSDDDKDEDEESHTRKAEANRLLQTLSSTQGSANPSRKHRSDLLSSRRQALARLLDEGDASRPSGSSGTPAGNDSMVQEIEREMEEQRLRDLAAYKPAAPAGKGDDRKTWGGAKAANRQQAGMPVRGKGKRGGLPNGSSGDFLLGKARRGMGDSLGTVVLSDEEDAAAAGSRGSEGKAAGKGGAGAGASAGLKEGQIQRPSLIFKRMGRSGVDDDEADSKHLFRPAGRKSSALDDLEEEWSAGEEGDVTRESEDEDWASEVDEDQWGWGGELEDTDVV
ncbi:hypothetical protein BCV69DRAFT_284147 [Microstroma glucosiphilum]|uniref:DNA replication regulator SLD2 n=1 Tax=Pseudomicrostroma glucosiphilum TaxID=1684307 RepID=A0A316U2W2_9BASI|nr:hypothetical protein BCV69DRAFT_284147 [Pseudomicrostroma glucosiphilum]PWN19520.1 hypothetical protein BCV69DRAFT_284147 [Pseudomicrostroma glucosiphilum]